VAALELSMLSRDKMNKIQSQTMSPSQKAQLHYKKSPAKSVGQICQEMAKLDLDYSPSPGPINPFSHLPVTCSTNLKIVDSLYCSCFELLAEHCESEKPRRPPPMRKSISLIQGENDGESEAGPLHQR
jgi:hypothetical protein